jgi:arylformamidase
MNPDRNGSRIWLGMSQLELDDAYDQTKFAPNAALVIKRYKTNSEQTRKRVGEPRRFSYGATPIETLDLFATNRPNAPMLVFVHGGAWRATEAKDYGFAAEAIVNAGAHYIALDFVNAIDAGGDLIPMVDQVRRAVAWIAKNAAQFSGDPDRIYICGHSSGGHLGGAALVTNWNEYGAPSDVVKGALLISGIYDLKPVRLSARSRYVKFTDTMEEALSTQRHIERIDCPVALIHGSLESPEFQRQSQEFAAALKAAAKPITYEVIEGYNHSEMMELLANPYSAVGRAALTMMELSVD